MHVTAKSKSTGLPYDNPEFCEFCQAWVRTEDTFCICCFKKVHHKSHFIRLKQILGRATALYKQTIDEYKLFPYSQMVYVRVQYEKTIYQIPLKFVVLYGEHPRTNEIMPLIQDYTQTVRK